MEQYRLPSEEFCEILNCGRGGFTKICPENSGLSEIGGKNGMGDNLPVDAVSHPVQYRSGVGHEDTWVFTD
jgi:hypothetical protein